MRVPFCVVFVVFVFLAGSTYAQLITPFQACEMKCIHDKTGGSSVSFESPIYTDCRDYCLKHAYDNLGNLGTLG